MTVNELLMSQLKELHLPAFREQFEMNARRAEQESWSFERYLSSLAQFECDARRTNRVERFLKMSRLPIEKSMDNFDLKKLPTKLRRIIPTLAQGTFLDRCENVLAFGATWLRKNARLVRRRSRTDSRWPKSLLQPLQYSGSRPADCKARFETQSRTQTTCWIRCHSDRRHRLRAAESRRDGSPVHTPGRSL